MDPAALVARLTRRLFGSPIVLNSLRGEVVEEMVAMALETEWEHCAGDWAAFDFRERRSGLRIQVKQSAARQSWHKQRCPPARPRFSIAEKTGRWDEGDRWVAEPGRNADLFVFAWHPLTAEAADHRDAHQWEFYVVAERRLPPRKSVSLTGVQALTEPVAIGALSDAIAAEAAAAGLGRSACPSGTPA
jgi:hypothetical protein